MGKALIISDDGEGFYTVEIKHNTKAADAQLTQLNTSLSQIGDKIAEEQAKDEPDQSLIAVLEFRKAAITKRISVVKDERDQDYRTQAWCADYTEGLTGDVGTIEPGTESKNGINIQPGHEGGAVWSGPRDGQATPFLTMDVADAMRNFAILPAIQKWRPTYRYGTISNIDTDNDICTVTLDALTSSVQGLNINHRSVFNAVPIEYMDCNASAFEDGDGVIVKFSPYNIAGQPKVIGFRSEPKPCKAIGYLVVRTQTLSDSDWTIKCWFVWDLEKNDYADKELHPALEGISWPASRNDLSDFLSETKLIASSDNADDQVWHIDRYRGEDDTVVESPSSYPYSRPSMFTLGGDYHYGATYSRTGLGICPNIERTWYLDAMFNSLFTVGTFYSLDSGAPSFQFHSCYLVSKLPGYSGQLHPLRYSYFVNSSRVCIAFIEQGTPGVPGWYTKIEHSISGSANAGMHTPIGSISGIFINSGYSWGNHEDWYGRPEIDESSTSFALARPGTSAFRSVYSSNVVAQIFFAVAKKVTSGGDSGFFAHVIASADIFEGKDAAHSINPGELSRNDGIEAAIKPLILDAYEKDQTLFYVSMDIRSPK